MKLQKKIVPQLRRSCADISYIWRKEYKMVFGDTGVLVFFFLLTLAYPLLYAAIYNPEVVRDVPMVVVDDSRCALSRHLVRALDASPNVQVISYCANMAEARQMMMKGTCYGILYIPQEFDKSIVRGQQGVVEFYSDMSLLIYYKNFLMALTDVTMELGKEIRAKSLPISVSQSLTDIASNPIPYGSVAMYNPESGFASFLIPAVIVLVLQQSIILGLGMLAGGIREENTLHLYYDGREHVHNSVVHLIVGKALCYGSLYIFNIVYLFHFIPWLFGYPRLGNPWEIYIFTIPLLFSSIFLGMTLSGLVREREASFLLFVFTSVVFIFLSGIVWPRYAMPVAWRWLGSLIPSTWGVEGFVQMNTTGASLRQVARPYVALWILTAVYFITAYATYRHWISRDKELGNRGVMDALYEEE